MEQERSEYHHRGCLFPNIPVRHAIWSRLLSTATIRDQAFKPRRTSDHMQGTRLYPRTKSANYRSCLPLFTAAEAESRPFNVFVRGEPANRWLPMGWNLGGVALSSCCTDSQYRNFEVQNRDKFAQHHSPFQHKNSCYHRPYELGRN